jgi:hypothetical protein
VEIIRPREVTQVLHSRGERPLSRRVLLRIRTSMPRRTTFRSKASNNPFKGRRGNLAAFFMSG